MGLVSRVRGGGVERAKRAYASARSPPEGVPRANRYERVRRNVWMVFTTVLALFVSIFLVEAVYVAAGAPVTVPALLGVFVSWLALGALIDLKLFAWGVRYFGLVPPWQFRVGGEPR